MPEKLAAILLNTAQLARNRMQADVVRCTSNQLILDVLDAGVRGYIVKSDSDRDPVTAVENLARKKPFFSTYATENNPVIAAVLGLSPKTVDTHRANIMRKVRVHTASELVRYAVRNQISGLMFSPFGLVHTTARTSGVISPVELAPLIRGLSQLLPIPGYKLGELSAKLQVQRESEGRATTCHKTWSSGVVIL
jgi:hypothetical protein